MPLKRTLIFTLIIFAAIFSCAANEAPLSKDKNPAINSSTEASNKTSTKVKGFNYTVHIDNKINQNNTVDSVLVILDKFNLSGAGVVAKVFYPDANNQIVIEDLPAGKYYAEIYVLGLYKKHFSAVIRTVKSNKKNKSKFKLEYVDTYTPGNAAIPEENVKLFAYSK